MTRLISFEGKLRRRVEVFKDSEVAGVDRRERHDTRAFQHCVSFCGLLFPKPPYRLLL